MTAEHIAKMRAGREAADQRRIDHENNEALAYLSWLKLDAASHRSYRDAQRFFGHDSPEARKAYLEWRTIAESLPGIPKSAAIERVRNN